MRPQIKLATCCYCGARTMLRLTARDGHELACGSCGAPLHEMKWLKAPVPVAASHPKKAPATPKPSRGLASQFFSPKSKPRKIKRRKPFWREALEDIWDEVEDIFD